MIRNALFPVLLLTLCLLLPPAAGADRIIHAGLPSQTYPGLSKALGLPSDAAETVRPVHCPPPGADSLKGAGRAIMEFAILCNAVFKAEIADVIELNHQLPHRRRLSEISSGKLNVSATTIFPEGLANVVGDVKAILSEPVLDIGDFEKGVFTLTSRKDVLAVDSLEKLRAFKAIMVKNWRVDVKTLDSLGLAGVVKVSKTKAYVNMLKSGRADFTISEFASTKTLFWAADMVRVPGIKIALASPRVFPVSPKRLDILAAIDSYLRELKSADPLYLRKLFIHADFIKPEFADWTLLNPNR